MTEEQSQPNLSVQISQEMAGGVWANFAVVSHSAYEFTIDFARMDWANSTPENVQGLVVSRVNLSPLMVSQLLEALESNWRKYADKALPKEARDHDDDTSQGD